VIEGAGEREKNMGPEEGRSRWDEDALKKRETRGMKVEGGRREGSGTG